MVQVDYEFDPLTNSSKRLYRYDQKQFSSNLSTILQWSPFATEAELLKQVRPKLLFNADMLYFTCISSSQIAWKSTSC